MAHPEHYRELAARASQASGIRIESYCMSIGPYWRSSRRNIVEVVSQCNIVQPLRTITMLEYVGSESVL